MTNVGIEVRVDHPASLRGPTIACSALRPLARRLADRGVDVRQFFAGYALHSWQLEDDATRIPFRQIGGMWELAAEVARDERIGLESGTQACSDLLARRGVLLTEQCLSYQEAAQLACSLLRSLSRQTHCHVVTCERETLVIAEGCDDADASPIDRRHALEFLVSAAFSLARAHAPGDWSLSRVFFPHEKPSCALHHESFFGTDVQFDADVAGFAFARASDEPAVSADLAWPEPCSRALAETERIRYLRRVERASEELLMSDGAANLAALSRKLGTGSRTLQRRLQELRTSHRELTARVRAELAIRLLRTGTTPVRDIALQLGFSDSVAFHRAFKRWTGMTPGAFRDQQRSEMLRAS